MTERTVVIYANPRGPQSRANAALLRAIDDVRACNAIVLGTVLDGIPESLAIAISLISGTTVSDATLARCSGWSSLQSLALERTGITDAGRDGGSLAPLVRYSFVPERA